MEFFINYHNGNYNIALLRLCTIILLLSGIPFADIDGAVSLTDGVGTEKSMYHTGELVWIEVTDGDLNTDAGSQQTVNISIVSNTETTAETVILTEVGNDTNLFRGSISTLLSSSAVPAKLLIPFTTTILIFINM